MIYVVLYKIPSGWRLFWAGESENIMKTRHNEAVRIHDNVKSGPMKIEYDWRNE